VFKDTDVSARESMKIVDESGEYVQWIKSLYEFYRSKEAIPLNRQPDFTVKITSDIESDIYSHASEEERAMMDQVGIPKRTGWLVLPNTDELVFTILIASECKDSEFVGTVTHELTHLFDYFHYLQDNGNVYIKGDAERSSKYFYGFYHWSEYHASRLGLGYRCVYEYQTVIGEIPSDGRMSFDIDFDSEHLVEKIEMLNAELHSHNANHLFWDVIQKLMGYYGRISVFQEESPDEYPDKKFPEKILVAVLGPECMQLYHSLVRMNTYENAKTQLWKIRELMSPMVARLNTRASLISYWPRYARDIP
jgi:hypothetical protein